MITVTHLGKEYVKGKRVLDDLNFDIEKGEMVFIIGESGAGKSTLIKIITREIAPTEGIIEFYDSNRESLVNIFSYKPYIYRRNIGIVFQDFKLIQSKTCYENIAYPLRVLGESNSRIDKKVNDILKATGISYIKNKYPNEISGGEQQRVGIARALINRPLLLLADEPTGNLDFQTRKEIMDLFVEANNRGTTILMVTHDNGAVKYVKKGRILYIHKGRLLEDVKIE